MTRCSGAGRPNETFRLPFHGLGAVVKYLNWRKFVKKPSMVAVFDPQGMSEKGDKEVKGD